MENDSIDMTYHLPVDTTPIVATPSSIVDETAKVNPTPARIELKTDFSHSEKLNDQALFDELNAISDEVIKCRDHVLSNIS